MQYRRELDGLRAVAVVSVIFFHTGFSVFGGGFVGVDVFFVISGYLITSLLIAELERGDFSLSRFYERRARRILPALFFVMLTCLPFAYMWMLPSQLKDFAQSLVAVVFFASNILFWREDGYFAAAVELKPLLHTWSLAVEEQYYVLFPLLMLLLWRLGRHRVFWIVIVTAVLSLLLAEWGSKNTPVANFYLAPTRAWELLAGSICAFLTFGKTQRSSNVLSSTGLAVILFAVFVYDENTPFPGAYALAPVVGTVLIILYAAPVTWVAQLLSTRGFVGIGLISYSAYLWHQPLFAFARLRSIKEPNYPLMAILVVVSLLLAWATWRYVEQPFRNRQNPAFMARRSLFATSGTVGAIFVAIGLAGHFGVGFSGRSNDELTLAGLDQRVEVNHGLHSDCEGEFNNSKNCHTTPAPEVLLWGDSYAMHLAQGMVASEQELALQQHTMSVCTPVIGIAHLSIKYGEDWAQKCIEFNNAVMNWLRSQTRVRTVVLSSPFSQLLGDTILMASKGVVTKPNMQVIAAKLVATANKIRQAGANVLIVSPTPRSGSDVGQCLVRTVYFNADKSGCDFALKTETDAYEFLRIVSKDIPVYWLNEDICDAEVCDVMQDGTFIYRDEGHLSKEGSAYLGRLNEWMPKFRAMAN